MPASHTKGKATAFRCARAMSGFTSRRVEIGVEPDVREDGRSAERRVRMTMLVRVVVALSAWAVWAGAVQAERAKLAIEVKQPINAVAFSPDGRQVISGSWDKTLPLAL